MTLYSQLLKKFLLLIGVVFATGLIAQGQTISLNLPAYDIAYIYSSGTSFTAGPLSTSYIPTGNINTTQTQVRSFIKFDLSAFQGLTISSAILNLTTNAVSGGVSHTISVNMVGYNATGAPYSNSPGILTWPLTASNSFTVTTTLGPCSVDVTAVVQAAINAGYCYVTFRLNDSTADGGSTAPLYTYFNTSPTLTLTNGAGSIPLGSNANNLAYVYSAGTPFTNGNLSGYLPTGNINTGQTQVRSFLKFPISAFQGASPSLVKLNLTRTAQSATVSPQVINVNLVNHDFGSAAFTNSPGILTYSVTSSGSMSVDTTTSSYSVDVTTAVKTAITNGYTYVTFRLNNSTTDGLTTAPSYTYFDPGSTATLSWNVGQSSTYKTIYVNASTGSDSNDGSSPQKAFQTVGKAQTTARTLTSSMTGNIEVEMAAGTYFAPTGGFSFTASDSGRATTGNNWRVIWRNAPGATVVWSGGQQLSTTWTQQGGTSVYKSATNPAWEYRQIYVNDHRVAPTASALVQTQATVNPSATSSGTITFPSAYNPTWTSGSPMEMVVYCRWTTLAMRVGSMTSAGGTTTIKPVAGYEAILNDQNYYGNAQSFYFENSKAFQGSIEDFYATPTDGLYYTNAGGINMTTATVIIPEQQQVLTISGTGTSGGGTTTPVQNIEFYGIKFEHTTFTDPFTDPTTPFATRGGYQGKQAGLYNQYASGNPNASVQPVPAGVVVSFAQNIDFEHCAFRLMDTAGLSFMDGVTHCRVVGNLFQDISASAINLMPWATWRNYPNIEPAADAVSYNYISDNTIDTCGTEYFGSDGIFLCWGQYNYLQWNSLTNLPYTGINVGFGWGAFNPKAANEDVANIVSENYIDNVMDTMNDGGGIYMNSDQTGNGGVGTATPAIGDVAASTAGMGNAGTFIYRNYIDNLVKPATWVTGGAPQAAVGIYMDNGNNASKMYNNAVQNIASGSTYVIYEDTFATPVPTNDNTTEPSNNTGITLVEAEAGPRPGLEYQSPPNPFTSVRNIAAYAKVYSSNDVSFDQNRDQVNDMRGLTLWSNGGLVALYPTVTMDFGRQQRITKIVLVNRQDGNAQNLALAHYQIWTTVNDPNVGPWSSAALATQSGSMSAGGDWIITPTAPATDLGTWRAIQFYKTDDTAANASEIRVYSDN